MGNHHDATIWETICYFFPSILSKYKFFVHKVRCCSLDVFSMSWNQRRAINHCQNPSISVPSPWPRWAPATEKQPTGFGNKRWERPFRKHRFLEIQRKTSRFSWHKLRGTIVSDICSEYGYCPDRSNQRQNLEEFFCPEELWRWLAYPSLDWLRAKGAWKMVLGKQSFGVFGAIFRSSVRFCSMVILKPQKISWKDPTSQISLF